MGDVTHVYDDDKNCVAEYVYDAWGNHTVKNYTDAKIGNLNPFRYRGYYYDVETKLYYLKGAGFFTALLIGMLVFALVNVGAQLVGDVINYAATGQWSSGWEDYLGAFIGGIAGGATFVASGFNLGATFAVMGGVQTLSTSLLTNATGRTNYSFGQLLLNTGISAGIGLFTGSVFGGVSKLGITAGRNSFMAVFKSGLTKLTTGTAARMSLSVMMKGLAGVAVLRSGSALINGGARSALDWINYLFGNRRGIGYI